MSTHERGERTRLAIIEAASSTFESNGYTAASLARIADLAQCTRGALYYHFASKQDLADAVREAAETTLRGLMDEARKPREGQLPLQAVIDLTHLTVARLAQDTVLRAGLLLRDEPNSEPAAAGTNDPAVDGAEWVRLAVDLLEQPDAQAAPGGGADAEALGVVLSGLGLLYRVQPGPIGAVGLTRVWKLLLSGLVGSEGMARYRPEGTGWVGTAAALGQPA